MEKYSYEEMNSIITMCLAENSKALERSEKELERLHKIIRWMVIGWAVSAICIFGYLAMYDVSITSYGDFNDSQINTSDGQQAKTMTINNLGGDKR